MPFFPPPSAIQGAMAADNVVSNNYRLALEPMLTGANNAALAWREQMQRNMEIMRERDRLRLGITPSGNYDPNFNTQHVALPFMEDYMKKMQAATAYMPVPGFAVQPVTDLKLPMLPDWLPDPGNLRVLR